FGGMTLAQAWASDVQDLLVLRFLDGLGIGAMIPNGAALISEFTPRRERALALAIGMTCIAVGGMVAGILGNLLLELHGWEGLFIVLGGIGVGVATLLLFLLPESPAFLSNSPADQARLHRLARRCGITLDPAPAGAM